MKNIILFLIIIFNLYGLFFGIEFTQDSFYFIQMSDLHFSYGEHLTRLKKMVNSINNTKFPVLFVAVTGDMTCENIEVEELMSNAISIMKTIKYPVYYLPGNHDIKPEKKEIMINLYKKYFGDLYYSFETNGVKFIFLYNEPLRDKKYEIFGYKPLEWVEKELIDNGEKPSIIFLHSPWGIDYYNNKIHTNWSNEIIEKWESLIGLYNIRAVIAGHYHRDELHWIGRIPLYVSSSLAAYWGRQASYRIYYYNKGLLSYYTVYIE